MMKRMRHSIMPTARTWSRHGNTAYLIFGSAFKDMVKK
ncbi:MAG: hypothetical protein BWX52_01986 [Bacteroidetes bacterium ADurb.Bin013]|nr:MAG: hypothetical protein BWX52_01986 [Bacteroidetes bacterium ADurb.Bin013]